MSRWIIHSKAGSLGVEAPTGAAAVQARVRDLAELRRRGVISEAQWRARQPVRVEAAVDAPIVAIADLYAPVEG